MNNVEFSRLHPIVNFIYFIFVIGFSMFFQEPICLLLSFFCAIIHNLLIGKKKTLLSSLSLIVFVFILNPIFNHSGNTMLCYLPSGNPLTLESIVYGFFCSLMIVSIILWFSFYNEIITQDKNIYLFSKTLPTLGLILSMTLSFIPKFIEQFKNTYNTQKTLGKNINSGKIINRIKNFLSVLSIVTTWSLENSIETSNSMKSRGYGNKKRTYYSIYTFTRKDLITLIIIIFIGIYILSGGVTKSLHFAYFPTIKNLEITKLRLCLYIGYFILMMLPFIIEIKEVLSWKFLKSKN